MGRKKLEELYTVKQASEYLKISRATLYKLIESGKLKPLKLGGRTIFNEDTLRDFVERLKKER